MKIKTILFSLYFLTSSIFSMLTNPISIFPMLNNSIDEDLEDLEKNISYIKMKGLITIISPKNAFINDIRLSPSGKSVYGSRNTISNKNYNYEGISFFIVNIETGRSIDILFSPTNYYSFNLSPNDKYLAATIDNTILIYDLGALWGELRNNQIGSGFWINANGYKIKPSSFSKNDKYLLVPKGKQIDIWDLQEGKVVNSISAEGFVEQAIFNSTSTSIFYTTSNQANVCAIDLDNLTSRHLHSFYLPSDDNRKLYDNIESFFFNDNNKNLIALNSRVLIQQNDNSFCSVCNAPSSDNKNLDIEINNLCPQEKCNYSIPVDPYCLNSLVSVVFRESNLLVLMKEDFRYKLNFLDINSRFNKSIPFDLGLKVAINKKGTILATCKHVITNKDLNTDYDVIKFYDITC